MSHRTVLAGVVFCVAAVALAAVPPSEPERPDGGRIHIVSTPITAVSPGNLPDVDAAVIASQDAYYADVQRTIDEYLAWQHEQDVAAWAAAHTPPPPRFVGPLSGGKTSGPYADAAECTRAHEGWYEANTGNGYYGAYQFLISTWKSTLSRMGPEFAEWINVLPSDAPPWVQDAAFWFLWADGAGAGHWGGRCREYA